MNVTELKQQAYLNIWNQIRTPPANATKPINGGRLGAMGFDDIRPAWRSRTLTELFGPIGVGWYWILNDYWHRTIQDEEYYFVHVTLYYRAGTTKDGETIWSAPLTGVGGHHILSWEKGALKVEKEGLAGAVTDALGKAMKPLGMAADVYWEEGAYDLQPDEPPERISKPVATPMLPASQPKPVAEPLPVTPEKVLPATPAPEPKGYHYIRGCMLDPQHQSKEMLEAYGNGLGLAKERGHITKGEYDELYVLLLILLGKHDATRLEQASVELAGGKRELRPEAAKGLQDMLLAEIEHGASQTLIKQPGDPF